MMKTIHQDTIDRAAMAARLLASGADWSRIPRNYRIALIEALGAEDPEEDDRTYEDQVVTLATHCMTVMGERYSLLSAFEQDARDLLLWLWDGAEEGPNEPGFSREMLDFAYDDVVDRFRRMTRADDDNN